MTSPTPKPSPEEWARGRWDVERWALVYLGIRLNPGQRLMAKAYLARTKSRWRALFLWIMVAAGNRAGKTAGLAVIIIHSCVYKMGLEPPDPGNPAAVKRWGRLPYHWWHFAIEQGPAEQTFWEIATMLGGVHPAQQEGCPWSEQVGGASKIALLSDTGIGDWCTGPKERGEYAWIKFDAELGGAEVHFRSTKAKALSAVGQNMHGLSFDEAGLETNLIFLLEEVMHARRLGTGGQFFIISTPSAATSSDFEDLWITGDPEDPFRKERRFSMRMSSRENVGFGLDSESFEALIEGMDEAWIAQNIDGFFIQAKLAWFNSKSVDKAFIEGLPEDEAPIEGETYFHALDPGLKDKLWSIVFKRVNDKRIRGVHIERIVGKQTTRGIVALGKRTHHTYEMKGRADIETGVDTTALGGHMFKDLLEEDDPRDEEFGKGIPTKSVEFGGVTKTKRLLLSDLRSMLDEGLIEMPAGGLWAEFRRQLRGYKLLDRKIEQDLVMGGAIVVKLFRQAAPRDRVVAHLDMTLGMDADGPEKYDDGINPQSLRAKMAAKRRATREARAAMLTADEE